MQFNPNSRTDGCTSLELAAGLADRSDGEEFIESRVEDVHMTNS